jgi:hypothetical protein
MEEELTDLEMVLIIIDYGFVSVAGKKIGRIWEAETMELWRD